MISALKTDLRTLAGVSEALTSLFLVTLSRILMVHPGRPIFNAFILLIDRFWTTEGSVLVLINTWSPLPSLWAPSVSDVGKEQAVFHHRVFGNENRTPCTTLFTVIPRQQLLATQFHCKHSWAPRKDYIQYRLDSVAAGNTFVSCDPYPWTLVEGRRLQCNLYASHVTCLHACGSCLHQQMNIECHTYISIVAAGSSHQLLFSIASRTSTDQSTAAVQVTWTAGPAQYLCQVWSHILNELKPLVLIGHYIYMSSSQPIVSKYLTQHFKHALIILGIKSHLNPWMD